MDQYLLIPFLGGWTSIYQLFWCSPGYKGFDTLPIQFLCFLSMRNYFSTLKSHVWYISLSRTFCCQGTLHALVLLHFLLSWPRAFWPFPVRKSSKRFSNMEVDQKDNVGNAINHPWLGMAYLYHLYIYGNDCMVYEILLPTLVVITINNH